ncbi:hypothetical protein FRC10_002275 [Ceratobasidium sp. 414]|nr:hypothetical protein FRC10_002275 [Ceratobasidium sp. 414]
MTATDESPIIFYDLASTLGQFWSFNTYKTRLTLNYKGIPYRVQYIRFHEIESTLKVLGVPLPETASRYTLPGGCISQYSKHFRLRPVRTVIADPSSDPDGQPTYVCDSFEIAAYLDDKYPAPKYPAVLPVATRPLQKIFVDQYFFTNIRPLFPFTHPFAIHKFMDEEERENLYQRLGKERFDPPTEEVAAQKLVEAREKWEEFGQALELNNNSGPFVMGGTITFADFAVGGIFDFLHKIQGDEGKVWKELMGWQGGRWATLWKEIKAVEKNATEVA